MDNKNKRRLRGFYEFSKKYPTQRGAVYAIGESKRTKILLTCCALALAAAVFVLFLFFRDLSRKPIPDEPKDEKAEVVSADNIGKLKVLCIENGILGDENDLSKNLKTQKRTALMR